MKKVYKIIVFLLLIGTIVTLSSCSGKLSSKKISKIDLGTTKLEVEEKLGTPYKLKKGSYYYEYFSKNYMDLDAKMEKNAADFLNANSVKELEKIFKKDKEYTKKAETMEYQYAKISFENDVVSEILFDAKKVGEASKKKELKNVNIMESNIKRCTTFGKVIYESFFEDGSYYKGTATAISDDGQETNKIGSSVNIHWSDLFYESYQAKSPVIENEDVTSEIGYYSF